MATSKRAPRRDSFAESFAATIRPLSANERAVVCDAVDQSPPLSPTVAAQLSALLRGTR